MTDDSRRARRLSESNQFFGVAEAAALMGVSRSTVYARVRRGTLECADRSPTVFTGTMIEDYLARDTVSHRYQTSAERAGWRHSGQCQREKHRRHHYRMGRLRISLWPGHK